MYHNNIYIIQAGCFNLLRASYTRPKNWKGFVELLVSFSKLGDHYSMLNLQNLAHGDKLIGRFYYIFHGFSHKNLRFPCISITQIQFW